MELVNQFLESQTLIADFWIADNNNEIKSITNEGIAIKKMKNSKKRYDINIIMKTEHFGQLELFAKDWKKKYPKAVITKGTGKVEAYDLRFKKAREKEDFTVLEFIGEMHK